MTGIVYHIAIQKCAKTSLPSIYPFYVFYTAKYPLRLCDSALKNIPATVEACSIKPSLAAPRQHDIPAVNEVCFWSLTLKSS